MNTQNHSYFFSQPHQPFFLLGVLNAFVMMLLFTLSYQGVVSLQIGSLTLHSYSLIFLTFHNFFTGFLFTTFPRFNQTQPISRRFYTALFFAHALASTLFIAGAFTSSLGVGVAMVVMFIAQIVSTKKLASIYYTGRTMEKKDPFWILIANYCGVFAHGVFVLTLFYPLMLPFAISVAFFLYIIFLAFSVAQRMVPLFSRAFVTKPPHFLPTTFALMVALTLFQTFNAPLLQALTSLALGSYLAYEIYRWRFRPFHSPAILSVLHLGVFYLPFGFIALGVTELLGIYLQTSFYFLGLHILAIGFLTTLMIGFGTRVILGHSGQTPHANTLTIALFFLVQLVVLLRVLVSFDVAFGWGEGVIFVLTSIAWLCLFGVWGMQHATTLTFQRKN